MEKRWQKSELAHLKRYATSKSVEELAQRFHTDAATVVRKLEDLGLDSGKGGLEVSEQEVLATFEEAIAALHRHEWQQAAELFETVVVTSDRRQLRDRAQQYLETCRRHEAEAAAAQEDPFLQAVYEKNRGEYRAALELCRRHGTDDGDGRFTYLLASLQALTGEPDAALKTLASAIELDSRNRVHAYHDPDFETLRGREELARLLAAG